MEAGCATKASDGYSKRLSAIAFTMEFDFPHIRYGYRLVIELSLYYLGCLSDAIAQCKVSVQVFQIFQITNVKLNCLV